MRNSILSSKSDMATWPIRNEEVVVTSISGLKLWGWRISIRKLMLPRNFRIKIFKFKNRIVFFVNPGLFTGSMNIYWLCVWVNRRNAAEGCSPLNWKWTKTFHEFDNHDGHIYSVFIYLYSRPINDFWDDDTCEFSKNKYISTPFVFIA